MGPTCSQRIGPDSTQATESEPKPATRKTVTMTPEQFRSIIADLNLTQEGAGKLLGRTGRTGQTWAAKGPSPEAAIVFELLRRGRISVRDVKSAGDRVC